MKKIVVVVLTLLLTFVIATTVASAEEIIPPVVKPGTGQCGGDIAEFPGGFAAFGCGENGKDYRFQYTRDPENFFGALEEFPSSGASYVTGSVNIYALENAKRVKNFGDYVEVCFWDPGKGTVRFWTGLGWQIMPTYVHQGFRCTITSVPGWYVITALSLER